jgi:hypothetical protein
VCTEALLAGCEVSAGSAGSFVRAAAQRTEGAASSGVCAKSLRPGSRTAGDDQ